MSLNNDAPNAKKYRNVRVYNDGTSVADSAGLRKMYRDVARNRDTDLFACVSWYPPDGGEEDLIVKEGWLVSITDDGFVLRVGTLNEEFDAQSVVHGFPDLDGGSTLAGVILMRISDGEVQHYGSVYRDSYDNIVWESMKLRDQLGQGRRGCRGSAGHRSVRNGHGDAR